MSLKSQRSIQQAFQNPQLRQFMKGSYWFENVTDSGAGIAAGRIVEQTANTVKLGTEQNTATLGVTRSAIAVGGVGDVQSGFVPVLAGCPLTKLDLLSARASGYVGKKMLAQVSLLDASAGGGFTNQPAGDGIEIVSDAAGDTTQAVTIYGTKTGATDSITTETVALNGVTAVSTTTVTWQNILGVRLSAACAGTITVREASANATVTTIAAASLTAGIAAATSTQAYGLVPRHDASGASTAPIAIIGKGLDGTSISVVDTLNGATEEDHAAIPYGSVVEFLLGAVAANVNVNVLTNETVDSISIGMVLGDTVTEGELTDAYISPYFMAD